MERKQLIQKIQSMGKIKYAILSALLGILFLALPAGKGTAKEVSAPVVIESAEDTVELRMEEILSQIQGAGKVHVMLTEKCGGSVSYQTDTQSMTDGTRKELRSETVFCQDDALVVSKTGPEYLGAVIVCPGGDSPKVCLELVKAVCSLTGLTSDKITVLKSN